MSENYDSSVLSNSETTTTTNSNQQRSQNKFVGMLALIFGVSSWIGVTAAYLQLPLVIATAPEGLTLPSYMTVIVQSSNILSLSYVIYQKYSPRKLNENRVIYIIMVIGCMAALGMAFFYQFIVKIGETDHSIAWLIFTFMFAMVGTISSVLFMPYLGRFRECYLIMFLHGQGLNGILPSILNFIQGIDNGGECSKPDDNSTSKPILEPRFNTQIFFFIIFGLLVVGLIAFILLDNLSVCKAEFAPGVVIGENGYVYGDADKHDPASGKISEIIFNLSHFNYGKLIATVATIGFFGNGIYPDLMSFSALPYGFSTYHLTVTLVAVANPFGSFIAMFVSHTSIGVIDILASSTVIIGSVIMAFTLQNPIPPFVDAKFGPVMIVSFKCWCMNAIFKYFFFFQILLWTTFTVFLSYMKTSTASIFRYQQGKALVLNGIISQTSSALGAIAGFVFVNFTNLFIKFNPC